MEKRVLRHDRHTVSLLTDRVVITPKYQGKILVRNVALVVEGIIRKTCVSNQMIERVLWDRLEQMCKVIYRRNED